MARASVGPTPWAPIRHLEAPLLVATQEAVERLGVLAAMVMDVEEDLVARIAGFDDGGGCDGEPIADACDLDQQLAVAPTFEQRAAQRADHRCASCGALRRGVHGRDGEMTQRDCSRVGCVGRLRAIGQTEQRLHHVLHLLLGGAAVAGDGFFHLVRGVLRDLAAA